VIHLAISRLTPCFKKTPCVYHLPVRLARDLLGQVSGIRCQDYEPDGVENY
jgi:hypothetical protein